MRFSFNANFEANKRFQRLFKINSLILDASFFLIFHVSLANQTDFQRRMVRLKSFECDSCKEPCRLFLNDTYFYPGICVDCGRLLCGACQNKFTKNPKTMQKCALKNAPCNYAHYGCDVLSYLQRYAPEDELKFLKFEKWSPIWCVSCQIPITSERRLGLVDEYNFRCQNCIPGDMLGNKFSVDTYMKIVDELQDKFSDVKSQPIKQTHLQLESLKCGKCEKKCCLWRDSMFLMENGTLNCGPCIKNTTSLKHAPFFSIKKSLLFLQAFLFWIPDFKDLNQLTYSKWTPLKCQQCSVRFSDEAGQNPVFHSNCAKMICAKCSGAKHKCGEVQKGESRFISASFLVDVIKEFRSHFRNGGMKMAKVQVRAAKSATEAATAVKKTTQDVESQTDKVHIIAFKEEEKVGEKLDDCEENVPELPKNEESTSKLKLSYSTATKTRKPKKPKIIAQKAR